MRLTIMCIGLSLMLLTLIVFSISKEIKEDRIKYNVEIAQLKSHDDALATAVVKLTDDVKKLSYQLDVVSGMVRKD